MSVVLIKDALYANCAGASLAKVLSNFVWMSLALHVLTDMQIVQIHSRCSKRSRNEFPLINKLKHMHQILVQNQIVPMFCLNR